MSPSTASVNAVLSTDKDTCVLSHTPLDVAAILQSVNDPGAGANVSFVGTTRNNFKNQTVTYLEYSAYSKLAIKTMLGILQSARNASPDLLRCECHHRLGVVPVGEPSIVVVVASPHRKAAFVACEFILEEVKRKAQIWKREYYQGVEEDPTWKENS